MAPPSARLWGLAKARLGTSCKLSSPNDSGCFSAVEGWSYSGCPSCSKKCQAGTCQACGAAATPVPCLTVAITDHSGTLGGVSLFKRNIDELLGEYEVESIKREAPRRAIWLRVRLDFKVHTQLYISSLDRIRRPRGDQLPPH